MAYNAKYQQKAYIIIMCIKININILCHFLWNDLTNNIILKIMFIAFKILNSSIFAKDSFKSILLLPWMKYIGPKL